MSSYTNKIIKLGKYFEVKLAAKVKKPIYYAVFLTDKSHSDLLKWWVDVVNIPILDQPFAHHMTVKFKPTEEDVIAFSPIIGQEVKLQVVGYAADDKGQAVLVNSELKSNNANPHITISCATGITPVYSNELLSSGLTTINGPTLIGVFDSFPRTTT
jgi:hypothetical protein